MNDKKTSVRTLTMLALLVAMSIVFSRVLSISTGFVRFNLGSLPVLLAAVVFGPGAGFAVGAVADIIGGVLAAHFVGSMVINSLALHIFYGYAWAVLIARIPNALVLTAVNTVLLRILLENRALMAVAKR